MLENTEWQSKINNPEKLATLCTQDTGRRQTDKKPTPLYSNKHK